MSKIVIYNIRVALLSFLFLGILSIHHVEAQTKTGKNLVQFSGLVLDGSNDKLEAVPFTTVAIDGTNRGTYSDWEGFFSIVAEKGDKVIFSAIGYKTVEFIIPDTLTDSRYSLVQLMTKDTINLPETVVFPWPSREHFKLEFLAMNVDDQLLAQNQAEENVTPDVLEKIREVTPMDGNENADYYLRQQAKTYYHLGQQRPTMITNVFAWKQFIEAWKNGDFKRKKKK